MTTESDLIGDLLCFFFQTYEHVLLLSFFISKRNHPFQFCPKVCKWISRCYILVLARRNASTACVCVWFCVCVCDWRWRLVLVGLRDLWGMCNAMQLSSPEHKYLIVPFRPPSDELHYCACNMARGSLNSWFLEDFSTALPSVYNLMSAFDRFCLFAQVEITWITPQTTPEKNVN